MEPSIKWAANPNVLVAAKAFGLKATVQVLYFTLLGKCLPIQFICLCVCTSVSETSIKILLSGLFQVVDFQVFVAPRITLKPLVPSFPCFAQINMSLMNKVCVKIDI